MTRALAASLFALLLAASVFADGAAPEPSPGRAMSRVYDSIAIVEPAREVTIFNNNGDLGVSVVTRPALRAGDRIALSLDERPVRQAARLHFELSGIPRGEHKLQSRIVDANGIPLISSAPVTFTMWHASRLFPNRRKER
jgi:hypothetical protein